MEKIHTKDDLISEWNVSLQSMVLPAEEWTEEKRLASIFSLRAVVVLLISIILIFPILIIGPYAVYIYFKREPLRKKISRVSMAIARTMPIPLNEGQYHQAEKTYWGKRLIEYDIIFLYRD